MKFRLTIYTAFETDSVDSAVAIERTIKSTLELKGLIVDETVLDEDVRMTLDEIISNHKQDEN
jgi:hypothetical protein